MHVKHLEFEIHKVEHFFQNKLHVLQKLNCENFNRNDIY